VQNMISLSFPLAALSKRTALEEIMKTNELSHRYGLILTEKDAIDLVETRNGALQANGRIEIGSGTIGQIIVSFCSSSFIWQENYVQTLHDLVEAFYYLKNETLDLLPDDDLIKLMRDYFENRCKGSLELLFNRDLEQLARNLRYGVEDYANLDEVSEDPEDYLDEEEMF